MLEDFVELIFEIIFEGVFDAATSKKAPAWLRVLLIIIIAAVCGGLFLLFFIIGMKTQDNEQIFMAFLILFIEIAALIYFYKKVKK